MILRALLLLPVLASTACASLPLPPDAAPPIPVPTASSATALLDVLVRLPPNQPPELLRADIARLDSERTLSVNTRFKLAILLGRTDDPADIERGLKILAGLEGESKAAQALIDLASEMLRARLGVQRQHARAAELQQRIDQIKALEKSLQQRDVSPAR